MTTISVWTVVFLLCFILTSIGELYYGYLPTQEERQGKLIFFFLPVPCLIVAFLCDHDIRNSLWSRNITYPGYRNYSWILAATAALVGDVFLGIDFALGLESWAFIWGVGGFMSAHIIFSLLVYPGGVNNIPLKCAWLAIPYAALFFTPTLILWDVLGDNRIPLLLYFGVCVFSGYNAALRYCALQDKASACCVLAGLLYIISDTSIGFKLFFKLDDHHDNMQLWIMGTYWPAHLLEFYAAFTTVRAGIELKKKHQ